MQLALDRTGGVQTRAAELLRMTFRQFRYKLQKHSLAKRVRWRRMTFLAVTVTGAISLRKGVIPAGVPSVPPDLLGDAASLIPLPTGR